MYFRMASLAFKARPGLRAIERSLAQLLALSGLPIEAFSGLQKCDSCRFGRSLAELHRYLSSSAQGAKKKRVSHSCRRARRSWGYSLACTCVSRTRYWPDPNVPLDMETLLVSPHDDCARLSRLPSTGDFHGDCERLPSTSKGQGALAKIWISATKFSREKSAHRKLPECRWMSHQTACPEARPNTIRLHRHQ